MKKDRNKLSVLFCVFGQMLVGLVIILALPSSLPRFFGYDVYNIVSGSMEPSIPVGAAAYVKYVDPITVKEGEVIAFESRGSIIVHRAVLNDTSQHTVITKGDANADNDMKPIEYNDIVGVMTFSIPMVGNIMVVATSMMGKIYLMAILVAGVLLQVAGNSIEKKRTKILDDVRRELGHEVEKEEDKPKKRKGNIWTTLSTFFLTGFMVVGVIIGNYWYGYYSEDQDNKEAAKKYLSDVKSDGTKNTEGALNTVVNWTDCPVEVDFASLKAINPEIVAWVYCEDTVINYAVCQTDNDDFYLTHGFDQTTKASGSIFLETENRSDFSDTNNVIYGHYMKNGAMFGSLSKWGKQDYFDEHNTWWLLTPDMNYKVELFSAYHTSALSDTYTVFRDFGDLTKQYISGVYEQSEIEAPMTLEDVLVDGDESQKYVVFSTCSYEFKNARFVIHGKMIPEISVVE